MEIFDAHLHLRLDNLEEFLTELKNNNITSGIVMIDPFIKELKCKVNDKHYVNIRTLGNHKIYCNVCNNILGDADNIYRKYNIKLVETILHINQINGTNFTPFITSVSSKSMLESEEQYFTNNYPKLKFGIKIYTGLSYDILDNVEFNSKRPLLIHSGSFENQKASNMIKFILNYDGPVTIAHFARFDLESISKLKQKKNVFFDTSGATLLYDVCYKNNAKNNSIYKPTDMFHIALKEIGIDRLIWGSDFPFSNINAELNLLNQIKLTKKNRQKILHNNAIKFLSTLNRN